MRGVQDNYELTDHLGNVHVVVSDRKIPQNPDNNSTIDYFTADLLSAADYGPFGEELPGRSINPTQSTNGFNGMRKDNEIYGEGNSYDFGARLYNPRLGRWMTKDPLAIKEPYLSAYSAMANNPILFVDPDGKENVIYLVVLPSAKTKINQADVVDIIKAANDNFISLGLDTRVVLFNDISTSPIDPNRLDKTDAIAVLGSPDEVKDYVNENNLPAYDFNRTEKGHPQEWMGGVTNPEASENYSSLNGGRVIMLDANSIDKSAAGMNSTTSELGGYLIPHGAGHNSGLPDYYQTNPPFVMSNGESSYDYLTRNKSNKFSDFFDKNDSRNKSAVSFMINRFQGGKKSNPAKANYSKSKPSPDGGSVRTLSPIKYK